MHTSGWGTRSLVTSGHARRMTSFSVDSGANPRAASSARSRAPAAVEVAGTWTASGMCARIHRRHWAQAWGCVAMRRMSPSPVPGRTARQKTMGTSISALISRGLPAVRLSSVALTPPSTEFSMGTTA